MGHVLCLKVYALISRPVYLFLLILVGKAAGVRGIIRLAESTAQSVRDHHRKLDIPPEDFLAL